MIHPIVAFAATLLSRLVVAAFNVARIACRIAALDALRIAAATATPTPTTLAPPALARRVATLAACFAGRWLVASARFGRVFNVHRAVILRVAIVDGLVTQDHGRAAIIARLAGRRSRRGVVAPLLVIAAGRVVAIIAKLGLGARLGTALLPGQRLPIRAQLLLPAPAPTTPATTLLARQSIRTQFRGPRLAA
jgi:hypothetical protein